MQCRYGRCGDRRWAGTTRLGRVSSSTLPSAWTVIARAAFAMPAALRRLSHIWGFAIYLASRDGYQDNILPSGLPASSPEEALDCACGLYLNQPTARLRPPTN